MARSCGDCSIHKSDSSLRLFRKKRQQKFEMTYHMAAFDPIYFQMSTHEEAASRGFWRYPRTSMKMFEAKPRYPGVALIVKDPKTGTVATGAMVQIIPADEAVVYSEMVTAVRNEEVTVKMHCTSKDKPTTVRFLLGNFFPTRTRVVISDGQTQLINKVVQPRSYVKVPGTDSGQNVMLADTGLEPNSVADRAKRPRTGISYTVTISRPENDLEAYTSTFDETSWLSAHPMVWSLGESPTPCFNHGRGFDEIDGMTNSASVMSGDLQIDGMTNSASVLSSNNNSMWASSNWNRQERSVFRDVVSYMVEVYFGKTLYRQPEPVKTPSHPKLTKCGTIIYCDHAVHYIDDGDDALDIVAKMKCPCASNDEKRYVCAKVIKNMLKM